jgi:hypothetical protein
MGGAATGLEMGAASMFYNPAGMANTVGDMGDVFVSNTTWIADMSVVAAAAAYNTQWLTVGVSFMSLDYGDVPGRRMTAAGGVEETGNIDLASSAIGIGLAKMVTNKFQVGLTARLVSEDLGGSDVENAKESVVSWDAGTLYRTGLGSSVLSMSIRNFSREAKHQAGGYDLPLIFRIGVAMDLLNADVAQAGPHGLLLSLDALHPRDRAEEALVGLEYSLNDMVFVRGATRIGHDYTGADLDQPVGLSLASIGAGVRYQLGPTDLSVNYAWSDQGELLGGVQRFDVQVGF